jgi:hypothetical protein
MEILNRELQSEDFEDFANQNLAIDLVCKGFSEACIDFYKTKAPLWQELKTLLQGAGLTHKSLKKKGVLIKGPEVTSLILCEAVEYFSRAFCNFYAQDELIQHGYSTWSEITNYYSSFFSIHALLRLQGRCITRIWRPKGRQVYVFPSSFQDHEYVISTKGVEGKNAHEAAWSLYYDVYDGFTYSENLNFESIFKKKYVATAEEEIDFRNKINYEPYQGYEEIWNPAKTPAIIKCYDQKRFTKNEIEILSMLTTDPDYQYYARSALRIIFLHSLFQHIAKKNNQLNSLFQNRKSALSDFLNIVKPRNESDMLCHRLQVILGLEARLNVGT